MQTWVYGLHGHGSTLGSAFPGRPGTRCTVPHNARRPGRYFSCSNALSSEGSIFPRKDTRFHSPAFPVHRHPCRRSTKLSTNARAALEDICHFQECGGWREGHGGPFLSTLDRCRHRIYIDIRWGLFQNAQSGLL